MSAAADKTQRECVFVCVSICEPMEGGGGIREMKRKSAPRMQEVEAPTERRVLIGCLETSASGRGISMHEICGQKEKENRGRDHSNITKSLRNCPHLFNFHSPRCPYINLRITKLDLWLGK